MFNSRLCWSGVNLVGDTTITKNTFVTYTLFQIRVNIIYVIKLNKDDDFECCP
jgi:hypothetical protein